MFWLLQNKQILNTKHTRRLNGKFLTIYIFDISITLCTLLIPLCRVDNYIRIVLEGSRSRRGPRVKH